MTTFSIVGSGAIGGAIVPHFARSGIEALVANQRGKASLKELEKRHAPVVRAVDAAEALLADIVILALPFDAIREATKDVGDWKGRIAVDATNAIDLPAFTPRDLGGRPSSHVLQDSLPGARVVKAFNTLPAEVLASDPSKEGGRRVLFVSGDFDEANRDVATLIERLGFFPVTLGKIAGGGLLQQFGGPLTVHNLSKY